MTETVNASIAPEGILEVLSRREVSKLLDSGQGGLYHLLRRGDGRCQGYLRDAPAL